MNSKETKDDVISIGVFVISISILLAMFNKLDTFRFIMILFFVIILIVVRSIINPKNKRLKDGA